MLTYKIRYEKIDDQYYSVHIGLGESIGTVQKMDNGYWYTKPIGKTKTRLFAYRGEAAEYLRSCSVI